MTKTACAPGILVFARVSENYVLCGISNILTDNILEIQIANLSFGVILQKTTGD